jgi:hypothetical protein
VDVRARVDSAGLLVVFVFALAPSFRLVGSWLALKGSGWFVFSGSRHMSWMCARPDAPWVLQLLALRPLFVGFGVRHGRAWRLSSVAFRVVA